MEKKTGDRKKNIRNEKSIRKQIILMEKYFDVH